MHHRPHGGGAWPKHIDAFLAEDTREIPVQVNGKLRATVAVPATADKDAVLAAAKTDERVAPHLSGREIAKEIYVPNKMVNFVVKP